MKLKFFKKFFLVNTLVIISSIVVIIVLLSIFMGNYITDNKKEMLKENCNAIATMVSGQSFSKLEDDDSITLFRTISSVTEAEMFVTDKGGKVLICSCDDWKVDGICEHNQNTVSADIITKALNGNYNEAGNLDGHFSQVKFTYTSPLIDSENNTLGIVFATIPSRDIRVFFNAVFKLFLTSCLISIIFMFGAEYYISYRFTKPLRLMSEAAHSMAKGDFSKRIPVTGDDEIGELSVAFNQMTNSLVQIEGTRRRFIANISHEFKTPMTTIGGFIDGIIDGTIPPEKQGYYLNIVSAEIKRLSRLVQSMLSLSKLESGEMQINRSNFDLFDMISQIIVSQEQRIEKKNLHIEGLEDMESVSVNADYDLIYQVVYNLVDNAIKFTNEDGTISFNIISFKIMVQFTIRNTGEGIKEKDLPFVFERFYKTDKSRSANKDSTGLGLHIANAIISIHGGKITVKSEFNNFTEFSFVLPSINSNETLNNKSKNK